MGFDPNEPRDPIGRWTTSIGHAMLDAASDRNKKIREAIEQGIDSKTLYAGDPQREALQQKIVDKYLATGAPSSELIAQFIGGAPANGKSALLASGVFQTPPNDVKLNVDDVKLDLPDYNYLLNQKSIHAAGFVHEESSDIGKKIMNGAIKMKSNITVDAVFDNGYDNVYGKIKQLKDAGYAVKIDYVTLDSKLSEQLADARAAKTGRHVNKEYQRQANNSIPNTFVRLAHSGAADELRLWDTNKSNQPRLVAEANKGNLTIYDDKLWKDFLNKEK
jgi:predicted ABC-type ATPase